MVPVDGTVFTQLFRQLLGQLDELLIGIGILHALRRAECIIEGFFFYGQPQRIALLLTPPDFFCYTQQLGNDLFVGQQSFQIVREGVVHHLAELQALHDVRPFEVAYLLFDQTLQDFLRQVALLHVFDFSHEGSFEERELDIGKHLYALTL